MAETGGRNGPCVTCLSSGRGSGLGGLSWRRWTLGVLWRFESRHYSWASQAAKASSRRGKVIATWLYESRGRVATLGSARELKWSTTDIVQARRTTNVGATSTKL